MDIPTTLIDARRAEPSLVIGGKDILLDLENQYVIKFCYTDNTSDKADDLSIDIADPNRTWMQRYLPGDAKRGIECEASITINDWKQPFDTRPFQCGIFYINNVHFKGPPNSVSIKASSIPPNGCKNEKKFKAWESANLRGIAGEIASQNELELFYDTQENPSIKRTDQVDKSDIEYLRELAKEHKLSLKIHKKQLVIYSEEEYESREPAFILVDGASHILEWDFVSKLDDCHNKCEVSSINTDTGKITTVEFPDENDPDPDSLYLPPVRSTLRSNESIEDEPDDPNNNPFDLTSLKALTDLDHFDDRASSNRGKGKGRKKKGKAKAKAKLREKNKKEHQSTIKVFGNIEYLSGLTCQTIGFGIFDRKWFIESSVHDVANGGYVTTLKLRGALVGY